MKSLPVILAPLSAIAASVQAYAVGAQIVQFTTIAWKTGIDPNGVITAGKTMVYVFFGLTALSAIMAMMAEDRLRKNDSFLRFLPRLASIALFSGALIWASMLASPYVTIVNR
jgi:ABC-type uncharacterized transport system permease subunit